MTEISFARSFLSALDMRPVKLSSDHIADPKQYPAQAAYTMPRLPKQPQKRKRDVLEANAAAGSAGSAPGSEPAVTVSLKNLKSSEPAVTLQCQALSTSVYDVKAAYAKQLGGSVAVDKIRLLYSKKPVADSKTLKDVLGPAAEKTPLPAEVAFSVMVVGGAAAAASAAPLAEAPGPDMVAQQQQQQAGPVAGQVLKTDEFWADLEGFLKQRIRDEDEGKRLAGVFRSAWQKSAS